MEEKKKKLVAFVHPRVRSVLVPGYGHVQKLTCIGEMTFTDLVCRYFCDDLFVNEDCIKDAAGNVVSTDDVNGDCGSIDMRDYWVEVCEADDLPEEYKELIRQSDEFISFNI